MVLFVLRKLVLQQTCSGARCLIFGQTFSLLSFSCVRTAKALVRLRGCAGLPEPSLVTYVISTIFSGAELAHLCSFKCESTELLSSGARFPTLCLKLPLVSYEHWHEKTCLWGLRPVKDSNWPAQLQKLGRVCEWTAEYVSEQQKPFHNYLDAQARLSLHCSFCD